MIDVVVRAFEPADLPWAESLVADFGGRRHARLGELVDVLGHPGFVAVPAHGGGQPIGILTYRPDGDDVEIVFIETTERHQGAGTRLVEALVEQVAASRLWLVTTNDNLDALRFYQRRGFRIVEIRSGAVDDARRTVKPTLAVVGDHGIERHDELVLERRP